MEVLALYRQAIRDDAEAGDWPDRLIGQEKTSRERRVDQAQARGVGASYMHFYYLRTTGAAAAHAYHSDCCNV